MEKMHKYVVKQNTFNLIPYDKLTLKSDLAVIPNVLYLPTKQIFNDLKSRSNKSKYIWHLDLYIYMSKI